jgi:hypothetical protein
MRRQQIPEEYDVLKKHIEAEIQNLPKSDMVMAYRFLEKIVALINLQYCATNFHILLESTEDEESRRLVEKHLTIFMTTVYIDYLNEVIDACNTWDAESSEMDSLQRVIWDTLVSIREYFEAKFGDLD